MLFTDELSYSISFQLQMCTKQHAITFFHLNSPAYKLFVINCHYKKLQLNITTGMFIRRIGINNSRTS